MAVVAEALDVLGTTSVDIVLSDVRMPVMDGVEFVRRLSGMAQAPPVVLLTGYADVSDAELRAGGVIAVLGKPVEVAALMETLRRRLSQSRWQVPPERLRSERPSESTAPRNLGGTRSALLLP